MQLSGTLWLQKLRLDSFEDTNEEYGINEDGLVPDKSEGGVEIPDIHYLHSPLLSSFST